jgi:hypothetical protein
VNERKGEGRTRRVQDIICGGREEWEGKAGRDMKISELGSVKERTRSYGDE